jgi:very-short-patch-repair endonuclease
MASNREQHFSALWKMLGVAAWAPVEQHQFHPTRKWRFDFAWLSVRVAVEIHGGEHGGGRHGRGTGMVSDAEKFRAAMRLGWIVIPVMGSELDKKPNEIIDDITAILRLRRGATQ